MGVDRDVRKCALQIGVLLAVVAAPDPGPGLSTMLVPMVRGVSSAHSGAYSVSRFSCLTFAVQCWSRGLQPEQAFDYPRNDHEFLAVLRAIEEIITAISEKPLCAQPVAFSSCPWTIAGGAATSCMSQSAAALPASHSIAD